MTAALPSQESVGGTDSTARELPLFSDVRTTWLGIGASLAILAAILVTGFFAPRPEPALALILGELAALLALMGGFISWSRVRRKPRHGS
jgi:hypothetical protein